MHEKSRLDVHHALGAPQSAGIPSHPEGGIGCAFDLGGRLVTRDIDRFTSGGGFQPQPVNRHFEFGKQHVARVALEYQGIKPVDEQEFGIGRLTLYSDRGPGLNGFGIGHDSRHGDGALLESGLERCPAASDADIGIMMEMGPKGGFVYRHRSATLRSPLAPALPAVFRAGLASAM